jgi:hypothetical protein
VSEEQTILTTTVYFKCACKQIFQFSDVVYVFLKNGGTLLHLEDGNNLKLVGNKEKNKCQSKLYEGQGPNWKYFLGYTYK